MATSPNVRRGFVPSRHLNGGSHFRSHRYPVNASAATGLFMGDPCYLSAGYVKPITTDDLNQKILGVIKACYASNQKPLTFSQPTRGPFLQASTAGWVDVYDDPGIVYRVQADATASQADVGKTVDVTASGGGNTATGYSRMEIDISTASAASEGSLNPFQIVGVAPNELDRVDGTPGVNGFGTNNDLEVVIFNGVFRNTAT